jgi:hypothetical protein
MLHSAVDSLTVDTALVNMRMISQSMSLRVFRNIISLRMEERKEDLGNPTEVFSVFLISVFKKTYHLFLPCAIWIQSTTSHPVSLRYILMSSHLRLGLPGDASFPTKFFCEFVICPVPHFRRCFCLQPCLQTLRDIPPRVLTSFLVRGFLASHWGC